MTLQNILHKLREIAQAKPNINFVGDGNVYDLNQKSDAEYSVFWMTPQGTDVYENLINHKLTLFYIDRLTDDWDNQRQIQSDGIRAINNIINTLVNNEDVEVSYPLAFTPFNHRFADACAGVFVNVTIITDGENICDYE